MKCNLKELALLSDKPCIMEGRLNYKKISGNYRNQTAYKERWFRLINNYLFYFKINEMGNFDTKTPAGVFVMENSSVQMEHGHHISFSFSISFIDEPDKRHIFAARSEDNVVQWVLKLRQCSYEYLRNQLHALQSKIYSITGKDPLLLVPRNDGACLWAPSVPFSTVPACTVNTSSFSCHLHTNGAFTLERSKSDVQAHRHLRSEYQNKAIFYTNNDLDNEPKTDNKGPLYSRTAPSPPVRTKLSPSSRRTDMKKDINTFTEQGKILGQNSILDVAPIPPRRKISPKHSDDAIAHSSNHSLNSSKETIDKPSEDLIQF
ncbi:unnamed protein product [Colias eurytheme]|nr:unnamed protein product [Colias eurytheme]